MRKQKRNDGQGFSGSSRKLCVSIHQGPLWFVESISVISSLSDVCQPLPLLYIDLRVPPSPFALAECTGTVVLVLVPGSFECGAGFRYLRRSLCDSCSHFQGAFKSVFRVATERSSACFSIVSNRALKSWDGFGRSLPIQRRFSADSAPFQRRFSAVSAPFQRRSRAISDRDPGGSVRCNTNYDAYV